MTGLFVVGAELLGATVVSDVTPALAPVLLTLVAAVVVDVVGSGTQTGHRRNM